MNRYLIILFFAVSSFCFGQNKSFKISGTVIAEDSKLPLESATIYLEKEKDSSLVTYTISDKNGEFLLENTTYEKALNLYISYVGYGTFSKKIVLDKEEISLNTITLKIDNNALDEVLIKSRAPITIKKDTLEFNVKSFKTKKDANVEDLLKELPGVEVDEEGKITVNGKDVSNILVNGKPFFGDDPTITTRNLTKEIIEKVQITDTKSKSEAFTGEEGDTESKTINLTISEENNKGVFGRVAAGGGTDERYEYAGIVNVFNNDQRISVLAGGNNTNTPGFSFGEIQKMFGNASTMSVSSNGSFSIDGRSFGGGDGIVTSRNIGANYADEFSKGFDIASDYFYSESDSENETKTERVNILPEGQFFTSARSKTLTDNSNHSFNTELDIEVDSTFLINVRPSFQLGNTQRNSESSEESFDENDVLTNSSVVSSSRDSEVRNFSNDLGITKRLGSNGSFIKASLNLNFNNSEGEDFLRSETLIADPNVDDIIRDQLTDEESSSSRVRASATYRLPLIAKKFFMDFGVNYDGNTRNTLNSTFEFNDATQEYDVFNSDLSTDFKYIDDRFTPNLEWTYREEKWSVSFDAGYVFRTLDNRDDLRPELSLKQDFEAVEIGSNFNVRLNEKASFYGSYNLSNRPPQINQITPFQDVSDPLNTVTGNPNLEPSNTHQVYLSYNSYDFQKGTGLFSYFNVEAVNNQVVTKTIVDENFIRNTTYANVDGNYNGYGYVNYTKSIKVDSLRTLKLNGGLSANMNRAINFNNEVQYASLNSSITPSLGLTLNWKNVLEFRPNYRLSFTRNTFDLPEFENQEFTRHSLNIGTALFVPKKFEWRNNVNFSYNPNVSDGFQKSIWFWNSTLAYSMLKDKGTLTLKVYDILNQNNNSQRTARGNFIQDSESTVLQRFVMLSFSYKFNSLGKKGETGNGGMFFFN